MKLKLPFFIISDSHWLHDNIVKYCGRPSDHEDRMVENWNKVVGPDDLVVHLGDLVFGPRKPEACSAQFYKYSSALNGNKVMVRGNHDSMSDEWYESHGFPVVNPFDLTIKHKGFRVTFSHIPYVLTYKNEINIHGHTHSSNFRGLTDQHINVSVEVRDYTPQPAEFLLDYTINKIKG